MIAVGLQKKLEIPEWIEYVPDSQSSHHSSHTAITNTGGCHGIGTLGNVPLVSAHGRCTELYSVDGSPRISYAAAWHMTIEYLQLQFTIGVYQMSAETRYLEFCGWFLILT